MMSFDLESYQTNALFVLIGENPLPNCVAALSLVQNQGKIICVHTQHTQGQAKNLGTVLAQTPLKAWQIHYLDLGESHANAYVIRQAVQSFAQGLTGSVGMHYTGGTKAMAVHAYRALYDVRPDAVFSYLDSHHSTLCIDQEKGEPLRIQVSCRLSLAQIFKLHGLSWRTEQPPLLQPILPEAAKQFAQLMRDREIAKAWRRWCYQKLHPVTKPVSGYWKSEAELAQVPPIPVNSLPSVLIDILRQYLAASTRELSLSVTQSQGFSSLRQVCEWLDGIWLEHYVLEQIQGIATQYEIHDARQGFHIPNPKQPRSQWDKFEFDVAFMRGYQLFALSCTTTANYKLCKQKLFEAAARSRQLGGGEARVALVCTYDRPNYIKEELEVMTRNRKLAVFGRQDLPCLAQKIASWIEVNE